MMKLQGQFLLPEARQRTGETPLKAVACFEFMLVHGLQNMRKPEEFGFGQQQLGDS